MAFRPLLSSFSPKKTLFFGEPKSTPLIFPTVHSAVVKFIFAIIDSFLEVQGVP